MKNCNGAPLVGVPAQEIVLFNSSLCICPGGNVADAATDGNGRTSFSGTIRGGGCVESLSVFADGVDLGTIPVKTNSFDHVPISPCHVDASDLASLAQRIGNPALYDICWDYNKGGDIDAGDLANFASHFHADCE